MMTKVPSFNTSILFMIFNRLETTIQVFDAIKKAKPPKLYIAADGPRSYKKDESETVKCVQKYVLDNIDWKCEVKTLFRDQNLGCKRAVSEAITWFFENEEEGIILEDDVLPHPSFFTYCEELLTKYRYEEKIALISGNNLISNHYSPDESYFFSHYANIWGWATWKRVWLHFDVNIKNWPNWRDQGGLKSISDNYPFFEAYWIDMINAVYKGKIDTWDFQFFYTCWYLNAFSIVPKSNLTFNLGFGQNATHTTGNVPLCVIESQVKELSFPLHHPNGITRQNTADILINKHVYHIGFFTIIKWKVRRIPILGIFLAKIKSSISSKSGK